MAETTQSQIRAQAGPQEAFLASPADLVIYGGAAGGGKSFALLLEPLRHVRNPQFNAVIFRRTSVQVRNPGGLWDESMKLYPLCGATPREYVLEWQFPSGATVKFAHMEHEKNRLDWQGAQIPLIAFDELTHFTRDQFFYMLSRNRSTSGVRPYMRATCNPTPDDDPVGGWVHELMGWYIGEDGYALLERSGVLRWFVVVSDELRWADDPAALRAQYPGSEPKSFTFILSSVFDNQILLRADPGYLANLMALPLVDRERLLGDQRRGGNWKIKPASGKVFNRAWVVVLDAAPPSTGSSARDVRFWDFAATEKKLASADPDWTVGLRLRQAQTPGGGRLFVVVDVVRVRAAPAELKRLVLATAAQDGPNVAVRWEIEPGSSGKFVNADLVQMLAGYDARGVLPAGDKVQRAAPMAAQALAGNLALVRAEWNQAFLAELHGFPDVAHDDQVDALSGAGAALLALGPVTAAAQVVSREAARELFGSG